MISSVLSWCSAVISSGDHRWPLLAGICSCGWAGVLSSHFLLCDTQLSGRGMGGKSMRNKSCRTRSFWFYCDGYDGTLLFHLLHICYWLIVMHAAGLSLSPCISLPISQVVIIFTVVYPQAYFNPRASRSYGG